MTTSISISNLKKLAWVSFPVLVYVLIPKNQLLSVQLAVPVIITLSLFVIAHYSIHRQSVPTKVLYILIIFYFALFFSIITLLLNGFAGVRGFVQLLKFPFFASILLSAVLVAKSLSQQEALSVIRKLGFGILIIQTLVVFLTFFSPGFFDVVWSSEKTRGFGQTLRLTGTVYNPNTFGLLILNVYAVLALSAQKNFRRKIVVLTWCLALILLSGSRTSVLIFVVTAPLPILFGSVNHGLPIKTIKTLLKKLLGVSLFFLTATIPIWFVIEKWGHVFRYVSRIRNLELLNPYQMVLMAAEQSGRLSSWESKWEYFLSAPGTFKWFVGLGPSDMLRVGDNDFFYGFWHWGATGSFLVYLAYLAVIFLAKRQNVQLCKISIVIFVQLLIAGLMMETFFSWFHPILFWVVTGLALGSNYRFNQSRKYIS